MTDIIVNVIPRYSSEYSDPANKEFSFIYHVSIKNNGSRSVQLISRHWVITDGDAQAKEVKGPGVVGEQPTIGPGEVYQYTSSVTLNTQVGTMEGCYQMSCNSEIEFDVSIPVFLLSVPGAVH
jgi:ApaG protein|tara:strand:+ start:5699 stop:6067 length:369 start_codon:yes stop_codon:yes gene_type:complete